MLSVLAEAVSNVSRRAKPTPTSWAAPTSSIDDERRNNGLFLSAGRGMGKTTVLLSLMRATGRDREAVDRWRAELADAGEARCVGQLDAVRGRLAWLDMLDMDEQLISSNLFAAILTRIERACGTTYPAAVAADGSRGILDPAFGAEGPLPELQRLATDVATIWSEYLAKRAGHLDVEPYAVELLRAERERKPLAERFRHLLDEIAGALFRAEPRDPVFVLPVDDFDLNPLRCAELLKLVRMLTAPRFFTIYAGDVRNAEFAFHLAKAREIVGVAGEAARLGYVDKDEVRSKASELGSALMRKLIPPGQRVFLNAMAPAEALGYRPDPADDNEPTLATLLGAFPIKFLPTDRGGTLAGRTLQTLRDLLAPETNGDVPSNERVPYSGATFLAAPPRRIADLWFDLRRAQRHADVRGTMRDPKLGAQDRDHELSNVLAICYRRIVEEEALGAGDRDVLLEALRQRPDDKREFVSRNVRVRWAARTPVVVDLGRAEIFGKILQPPVLYIRRPSKSPRSGNLRPPPPAPLPAQVGGMVILLHDLYALARTGTLSDGPIVPEMPMWGGVRWDDVDVPWFLPNWTSFWEFQAFIGPWNAAVRHAQTLHARKRVDASSAVAGYLAYAWHAAATAALMTGKRTFEVVLDREPSDGDWQRLIDAIYELRAKTRVMTARRELVEDWQAHVACNMAPECGVPVDVAVRFADSKLARHVWLDVATEVRRLRGVQAYNMVGKGAGRAATATVMAPYLVEVLVQRLGAAQDLITAISKLEAPALKEPLGAAFALLHDLDSHRRWTAEHFLSLAQALETLATVSVKAFDHAAESAWLAQQQPVAAELARCFRDVAEHAADMAAWTEHPVAVACDHMLAPKRRDLADVLDDFDEEDDVPKTLFKPMRPRAVARVGARTRRGLL
jgi:hypothetical protein